MPGQAVLPQSLSSLTESAREDVFPITISGRIIAMEGGTAGWEAVVHRWLIPRRPRQKKHPIVSLSDDDVDWPATIRVASRDFAVTTLTSLLEDADLLGRAPTDVQRFLRYALAQNAEVNRQIRDQCLEIGNALARRGLHCVLLKGAAWLFEPGPAVKDRMLRDIDLLAPRHAAEEVQAVIAALGYAPVFAVLAESGHIHDRPMEHPTWPARVEMHRELTIHTDYLGADEVLAKAQCVAAGLLVPSSLHRMIHNVVHAQIVNGDFIGGALGFRDAIDLGRLLRNNFVTEDWCAVAADAHRRGFFCTLSGALHKAAYVSGADLPEPFRSDTAGRRHLRRCLFMHRWPLLEAAQRQIGVLCRALMWERDAHPLGLGNDRSLRAHFLVGKRRAERIGAALKHSFKALS